MSAHTKDGGPVDFETCPVGTMARLRLVEEAAREVVRTHSDRNETAFSAAMEVLFSMYLPEIEAERQSEEFDRMRAAMEDR